MKVSLFIQSNKSHFFLSLTVFYNLFMLYWSLKCSYSKYSVFRHLFYQKMSTHLDKAKEKVKSLKIEKFDKPPKSGHLRIAGNLAVSAIQRFDCRFILHWFPNFKTLQSRPQCIFFAIRRKGKRGKTIFKKLV